MDRKHSRAKKDRDDSLRDDVLPDFVGPFARRGTSSRGKRKESQDKLLEAI
jgi:hypothetical protein